MNLEATPSKSTPLYNAIETHTQAVVDKVAIGDKLVVSKGKLVALQAEHG